MSQQDPGWYYAQGDPPGTMRYWDGGQWVGEPTTQSPTYAAPGGRSYGTAGARLGARIIDAIIVIIPTFILAAVMLDTDDLTSGSNFGFALLGLIIGILYEVGFVATRGATPGKSILGLKVITEDGQDPPGWGPAFMRWLPALVGILGTIGSVLSLILAIASGVMISSDDENRSVPDRVGKTRVIRTR